MKDPDNFRQAALISIQSYQIADGRQQIARLKDDNRQLRDQIVILHRWLLGLGVAFGALTLVNWLVMAAYWLGWLALQ